MDILQPLSRTVKDNQVLLVMKESSSLLNEAKAVISSTETASHTVRLVNNYSAILYYLAALLMTYNRMPLVLKLSNTLKPFWEHLTTMADHS